MKDTNYNTDGISLSDNILEDLRAQVSGFPDDKIFIILDTNTEKYCWPVVKEFRDIDPKHILVIQPGEENKNLSQVEDVWNFLGQNKADRKSLVINLGGGMLTDLGGFAAGTFKRGISFVNIPTTLLAMVDASVGGKNGINFRGLKNEIGLIQQPEHVFLHLPFLRTIDDLNFRSGFAEMLKAGLIADKALWHDLKEYDLSARSENGLSDLLWRAVMIKKDIVVNDPNETGIRKALNFGHTIGHALESYSMKNGSSVLHGYAVAHGMVLEAGLSISFAGLKNSEFEDIVKTLRSIYGPIPKQIKLFEELIALMRFDKKNEQNRINFTLLNEIGSFSVNNYIEEDRIKEALLQIY